MENCTGFSPRSCCTCTAEISGCLREAVEEAEQRRLVARKAGADDLRAVIDLHAFRPHIALLGKRRIERFDDLHALRRRVEPRAELPDAAAAVDRARSTRALHPAPLRVQAALDVRAHEKRDDRQQKTARAPRWPTQRRRRSSNCRAIACQRFTCGVRNSNATGSLPEIARGCGGGGSG